MLELQDIVVDLEQKQLPGNAVACNATPSHEYEVQLVHVSLLSWSKVLPGSDLFTALANKFNIDTAKYS